MSITETPPGERKPGHRAHWFVPFALTGAVAGILIAEVVARQAGFPGPLPGLVGDVVGVPKSASVPWAGLVLAMVGLTVRDRRRAIGAAVLIDGAFLAVRVLTDGPITVGNGPTIVLALLALYAAATMSGETRRGALRGIGLGVLLVLSVKIGDAWLELTVLAGPEVLDEYVQLADHALGNPSWLAGQILNELGGGAYAVLHWVYIELPVAAIVVAVYQLRNVGGGRPWPAHHLVRTFLLIGLIGPLCYVLFPVVGPVFAFGDSGSGWQVADAWPTWAPLNMLPAPIPFDDETPRNCMPSLHTAWATALFLHSRSGPRWLRWMGAAWLACTLAATLGFGYHYGVDLVTGAVLCLTLESALRDPDRGWGSFRIRLVAGGTLLIVAQLAAYRYLPDVMAAHALIAGPLLLASLVAMIVAFRATFPAQDSFGQTPSSESISPSRPSCSR
ncbi:DUF5933 domain-containing protein [Rhodococcus sp. NPDC003383]